MAKPLSVPYIYHVQEVSTERDGKGDGEKRERERERERERVELAREKIETNRVGGPFSFIAYSLHS